MSKFGDDYNPDEDPAAGLRRRLGNQSSEPTAEPSPEVAPTAPVAQFDTSNQYTPQIEPDRSANNESYQPPPVEPGGIGAPTAPVSPYTLPPSGTPIYGEGGVFNQTTGTVNAPYTQTQTSTGREAWPAPSAFADVPGFDTAKINDQTHVNDKYSPALRAFSMGLAAGVPLTRGDLSAQVSWAKSHGFPNAKQVGDDSVDYGDGHGPIDLIRSDGATMFLDKAVWGSSAAPAAAAQTTGATGAPRSVAGASPMSSFGYSATGAGIPSSQSSAFSGINIPQGLWNPEFTATIRNLLMQRLHAASQPVDENESGIAQTLSAARDETSRASDRERNQLAERAYAQGGLNTDLLTREVQQSGEKNAGALISLRAKLLTNELQSRRDELKSLLSMALQTGDAESTRQIQLQLADLESQLRREALGVSLAEFGQTQNAQAGNPSYY